jgi:hypothetical protein
VARPPALDGRAPIVDLTRARGHASLVGVPPPGKFSLEDALGNRLLDGNVERGARVVLSVPTGRLYFRSGGLEATLDVREGDRVDLARVALASPTARARGAIEGAMERGLFAAAYGPGFYRAFIEGREELVPIPIAPQGDEPLTAAPGPSRTAGWVTLGAGGVLGAATGVLFGLTLSAKSDWESTSLERPATEARDDFTKLRTASVLGGALTALAVGVGVWLLVRPDEPRRSARVPLLFRW